MTQVILATNNAICSGRAMLGSGQTGPALVTWDDTQFSIQRGITYSTSTKRFTVAAKGIYQIVGSFMRSSVSAATFSVLIGVNTDAPTTASAVGACYTTVSTGPYIALTASATVSLAANDYITFYILDGNLYNPGAQGYTNFSIVQIG
jgi:hypothetical protein